MDLGKAELRAELKRRLASMSFGHRQLAGQQAMELLIQSPEYLIARSVLLFVSLPSELDTRALIGHALQSGKRVAVPRANLADRSMQAVRIHNLDSAMEKTPIGVLEPRTGDLVAPAELDLVLTPGLGFGPAGERIGRGAGFYDRFLADGQFRGVACGYGLEMQVIGGIPMETHDTPLAMLVTEIQVRRFASRGVL